jgi:hypothetical protein
MPRSPVSELIEDTVERLNTIVNWHELPVPLGILNLIELRNALREENLTDTSEAGAADPEPENPGARRLYARTADGGHNDLSSPGMGATGARFGRNVPLDAGHPDADALMSPNPREISRMLLGRDEFVPVEALNLIAAAWIQFMTHDWFSHETSESDELRIPPAAPEDGPAMVVPATRTDPSWSPDSGTPPAYRNRVTHWWDGSQIYGSDRETVLRLREGQGGRLRIGAQGRVPRDPATGLPQTGFTDNWWLGLDLMHSLFILEHNAICAHLAQSYPDWDDDALYDRARLINSALMAKIHTVEWTPAILQHPTLQVAMRANWWGLQGEESHDLLGRISESEAISGIPGSSVDHHGAPFQMTEEFVSVYRMHPLMPDELSIRDLDTDAETGRLPLALSAFLNATAPLQNNDLEDLFYSFGRAHPGALCLRNYPNWLRELELPSGRTVDLAAVDILRDRERGVPRYCAFRRLLRLPAPETFDELTDDTELARALEQVYEGDIEKVDAMVGMFAETPPKGFGFSDTAFRIFILMASRRLKSDRFYAGDFTEDVYTPEGMEWIEESTMKTVLIRHFPKLTAALRGVDNAFFPWSATA